MSTAPRPSPTPAAVHTHASAAEELRLLRQVADHEPQAFEALYQRYAPALRRFLRRRLPHPDLADDVCHDVLLVAWQQAARFQPQARLSTWLCGIAQHRAQKAWHRVARQAAAPYPPAPGGEAAADPEGLLLHQEQHQGLARAVAQLPPELRVVVEAAYYQAASYEAIARRLGCPVGTVQTRLFRARRRLRAALVRAGQARPPARRPAGDPQGAHRRRSQ
jgi:RNA polymerase sigma factor (sigma-70 family)